MAASCSIERTLLARRPTGRRDDSEPRVEPCASGVHFWRGTASPSSHARGDDHHTMNFSDILAALNKASAFELYRLRTAIDRVLDQPGWMDAVRSRLRVGQNIDYFDPQANRTHSGQVIELRRKQAVILNFATGKRWLVSYAAINLDGIDVDIRERSKQGLGRNEVAIGDVVGFVDRYHHQRSGRIVRLNDKTVTLMCGQQQWRVAYALLHRVVDSSASGADPLELAIRELNAEAGPAEPDE